MKARRCTCPRCTRAAARLELAELVWPLVVPVVELPSAALWAHVAPFVTRWGRA